MLPAPGTYKGIVQKARETIFGIPGPASDPLARLSVFSSEIDQVVAGVYSSFIDTPSPDPNACVVALGGYGRAEMFPYSDVDILILHDFRMPPKKFEAAVRYFWDMGLAMGCVVRTIYECGKILGTDIATDAAFLESRLIAGNPDLYDKLIRRALLPYFRARRHGFISEMRQSLRGGLYSSNTSLYRTEPDLKNGVCCLRDCQRVRWAEMVRTGLRGASELALKSVFLAQHGSQLRTRYAELAQMRIGLHSVCDHRVDVLETPFQKPVA
jgi:[protein-PII] uridylyltransferase